MGLADDSVCNYLDRQAIIADYELACLSRAASVLARQEVLNGRAKFGIFGDGKEVAQIALAHFFAEGDWRSGYYRDQTLMFALQMSDVRKFFAQLYADSDRQFEPASGGRQMVCHFATDTHAMDGRALSLLARCNSAADLSPVAAQMGRAVGLAYASKLYRQTPDPNYSKSGNEVTFATIGDASTSEGLFWEAINAAAVLQVPLVTLVWDDNYGISVPTSYQTCRQSISTALGGFKFSEGEGGIDIYTVAGWDYNALFTLFRQAIPRVRKNHVPAVIHVQELTQPQGHSTSGSHERYKDSERLHYERQQDCLAKFRGWLLENSLASDQQLDDCEQRAEAFVKEQRDLAWQQVRQPIEADRERVLSLYQKLATNSTDEIFFSEERTRLEAIPHVGQRDLGQSLYRAILANRSNQQGELQELRTFYRDHHQRLHTTYSSHLYCHDGSALAVPEVKAVYDDSDQEIDGRLVILACFDNLLQDQRFFAIGEDIGQLGGVNLCFEGLQEKFGNLRVTDTGIREATILGQGIGAALRGLRPIVDIQYLDYLLYCLQLLSDDLASLHYRTAGGQRAPVIIRTKGHRLEGIWHTGSMLGMVVNAVRGVYLCVPRNMVQALGMYNTIAQGDDPAIVVEVLNAYRCKERLPKNYRQFTVPLGVAEVVRTGRDLTIVTYGACLQVANLAGNLLEELGIDIELVDVQCLLPFDRTGVIRQSLAKTNAVVFVDEDMPGGASAYMLQQSLEMGDGYDLLEVPPVTVTAGAHRGAYGSDGDYYSKPNAEQICTAAYNVMRQRDPARFPELFA